MAARQYRLVLTGAVLTVALTGCSALGITRTGDTSSPTSDIATSAPASPSPSPSGTVPFGQDATPPDDGVGSLTFGPADRWLLTNEDDNIHAEYLSMPGSPQLAVAQQGQVSAWVAEYRTFLAGEEDPGTVTPDLVPDAPTEPTSTASPSPQTEAGTATAQTSPAGTTGSPGPEASTPAAGRSPGGAGPEEVSLRVVPQLLSDGRVVGVRLYARLSSGQEVREHVRTFWADGADALPGQVLFRDAGQLRRLVLDAPGGTAAGALSDTELFAAVAFTTTGDLVVYLPVQGESDRRVLVESEEVAALLSDTGRAAQDSAREATVPDQPTGTPGESAGETDGESPQTPGTSATTGD